MKLQDLPIEMILHSLDFLLETNPLRARNQDNIRNLGLFELITSEWTQQPIFRNYLDKHWEIILLHFVHITLDKNGRVDDAKSGTEFSTVGFETYFDPIKERNLCKSCFAKINTREKPGPFLLFQILGDLPSQVLESSKYFLLQNLLSTLPKESFNFVNYHTNQVIRVATNTYYQNSRNSKFYNNCKEKLFSAPNTFILFPRNFDSLSNFIEVADSKDSTAPKLICLCEESELNLKQVYDFVEMKKITDCEIIDIGNGQDLQLITKTLIKLVEETYYFATGSVYLTRRNSMREFAKTFNWQ